MKNLLILPFIIYATMSCATIPPNLLSNPIDNTKNEGMIVGTISLEDLKSWTSTLTFIYVSDTIIKGKNTIAIKDLNNFPSFNVEGNLHPFRGNIQENGKQTYLFSITKSEGNYIFFAVRQFMNSGYIQSERIIPLKYPFHIEKGKTTYLGEINIRLRASEANILNSLEKDRKLFQQIYPHIVF